MVNSCHGVQSGLDIHQILPVTRQIHVDTPCCLNSPSTNIVLATKVIKLVHIHLWIVYVTLQIETSYERLQMT